MDGTRKSLENSRTALFRREHQDRRKKELGRKVERIRMEGKRSGQIR
jgi:hypothetical protein